jgi:hypothetical protein
VELKGLRRIVVGGIPLLVSCYECGAWYER